MRTEIEGHRVTFDPGAGWRCNCASWHNDGWGCEHTVEAAAMQVLERATEERGGSSRHQ